MIKHFYGVDTPRALVRLGIPFNVLPRLRFEPGAERLQYYAACREAGFPVSVAMPFTHWSFHGDFLRVNTKAGEGNKYVVSGTTYTTTAVRMLEYHPVVRQAVTRLQQEVGLTREDILAGMMDAVYAASTSAELVMAWREIGRLIGAYAPNRVQIEHTSNTQLLQRISMLSDAELVGLIAGKDPLKLKNDAS